MKASNLVSASLLVSTCWLPLGCLTPGSGDTDRAEQHSGDDPASDEITSVTNSAEGSGIWVFVSSKTCRDDCTERGCSCAGPICPGAPADGQPCTFARGRQCLVKRAGGVASAFYCEQR